MYSRIEALADAGALDLLKRVHFPARYSCLISIVIESVLTKPVRLLRCREEKVERKQAATFAVRLREPKENCFTVEELGIVCTIVEEYAVWIDRRNGATY